MNSTTATLEPARPRARDWLSPLELLALAAIWGASFMFQRVAAPQFGALPLMEIRLALGATVLLPALWLARQAFSWRQLPLLLGVGLINTAVPFALFAWAAERAPAGIGAITNSLAVLFTALVAWLVYGERISRQKLLALLIGFAGVVVLVSGRTGGQTVGLAALAGTAAALCYGFGANLVRRKLAGLPPVALGAATLGPAALVFAPFAWAQWPDVPLTTQAWASALVLGVVCTGLAYAFYFRLIKRIGAPRAVTVTYLIPLFGVGWAWAFLGEAPSLAMGLAGLLILAGVAAANRAR